MYCFPLMCYQLSASIGLNESPRTSLLQLEAGIRSCDQVRPRSMYMSLSAQLNCRRDISREAQAEWTVMYQQDWTDHKINCHHFLHLCYFPLWLVLVPFCLFVCLFTASESNKQKKTVLNALELQLQLLLCVWLYNKIFSSSHAPLCET